jgi:uncharacterized protein YqgC (DUF456 family)
MDTVLLILAIIVIIVGLVGCVVPVIPGIPLAFAAIFLYSWYDGFVHIGAGHLIFLALLTALSMISDFVLIGISSRLTGSSKYSAWGATIGAIIGFFIIPPLGIIIFCLLGAFVAEYFYIKNPEKAMKAALGSVMGLFSGIVFKVVLGVYMLVFFIIKIIR